MWIQMDSYKIKKINYCAVETVLNSKIKKYIFNPSVHGTGADMYWKEG